MEIEQAFENKFFKKLKKSKYVGVEIEMPLINLKKPYQVDTKVVQVLFQELLKHDFKILSYDNDHNIISIKNIKNGDTISLEYSFNTLEFSLNKEINIYNLSNKFNYYYKFVNDYLTKYNHKLCDTGLNPNYRKINRSCLNQDRYKIIEKLLVSDKNLLFSQFCSYCCSIQTHINVSLDDLTNVFNLFTLVSKNKDDMFANSYMEELNVKNARKYLWNSSNFGPLNIGENKIYNNLCDIKKDYLERNLFYIERNNKFYLLKDKCSLSTYFKKEKVEVILENGKIEQFKPLSYDFDNFRSYKEVELTKYGTLEIRTDCTQKYDNIFKVVAFNVGISLSSKDILEYIEKNNGISNDKLLEFAISGLKLRKNKEELLLKEEL